MDKIKVIVLTCDIYHDVTNHMITMYEKTWPNNPFVFRVPWNEIYPEFIKERWGDKVELIKTPVEFKKTIDGLTADLDGDEWIYWACDDVYPIEIEPERCNIVADWVRNIDDNSILSVSFINWENDLENNPVDEVEYDGLRFVRKKSVTNQWQHHFWRVKVLQTMFDCLDEPDYPKQMDYMQKESSSDSFWDMINIGKWYVCEHNSVIMGEPTSRGKLTINGLESFKQYNLTPPTEEFEVGRAVIFKQ